MLHITMAIDVGLVWLRQPHSVQDPSMVLAVDENGAGT
jgi:hypothetical protein